MRMPGLRTLLLTPVVLLAIAYLAIALRVASYENVAPEPEDPLSAPRTIAIFGASGTAGDGILKAALADPDIRTIRVFTRRATPRIDAGVATGRVEMTIHMDYLDYTAISAQLADVDAVFWAIGLSSLGVDEETYRRIHVTFPRRFVAAWAQASTLPATSFHYISSSDISEDSRSMWARVKVEAENALFDFAAGSPMRVIAYRPDYIGPTDEEAHVGQDILYAIFKPLGAAVKAEQIGRAMLEVTARGDEFRNGDKLSTWRIIRYSDAYERRRNAEQATP